MIVSKNTLPENDIYYLGSIVIDSLEQEEVDFFSLFKIVNLKQKMSIVTFTLTIDWLYLLGVVESDQNIIRKCF